MSDLKQKIFELAGEMQLINFTTEIEYGTMGSMTPEIWEQG